MSDQEAMAIKADDVFHFRYHPPDEQGWDSRTHCFEGILIAKEGDSGSITLHDTYWSLDGRDGRWFTPAEAESKGTLTHYCNLNEIDRIDSWKKDYYADADLIWLHTQHACSANCQWYYVRKGAVYNKEKMMSVVDERIRVAQSSMDAAIREIGRLAEIKEKVAGGDLKVYL